MYLAGDFSVCVDEEKAWARALDIDGFSATFNTRIVTRLGPF